MNQLVEALSPLKSDFDGPHNTPNTPSSGRVLSKPSAAAQARAVSRQASSPENGNTVQVPDNLNAGRKASMKIISANPGGPVQSKKERDENKENTPETRVLISSTPNQPTSWIDRPSQSVSGHWRKYLRAPIVTVSMISHRPLPARRYPR